MHQSQFFPLLLVLAIAVVVAHAAPGRGQLKQLQDAETIVTEGVKNNVINSLSRLAQSSFVAGTNISRASALVIRSIVREGFNLGGVAAYMPKLIFLDGPQQFIETLRLIRSKHIRVPNDLDDAIDILITFAGSMRDSGITGNLAPVVEFFPNIFTGVEKFAQDVIYNVFAWVGPVPEPASLDNSIKETALRVASTTIAY